MTEKGKIEDSDARFDRFEKAKSSGAEMFPILSNAYRYCAPLRNDFYIKTMQVNPYANIFSSIAIDGLKDFANNIQSLLTPPEQRWAKITVGRDIELNSADKTLVEEALEEVNLDLFYYINNSTFYQASYESFQDMGVSTGVTLINEDLSNKNIPFTIVSIPLSQVYFELGPDRKVQNFWRVWTKSVRKLILRWPDIEQTDEIKTKLANNPDEDITVIEGCIYYPELDGENQYYYYVQDMSTRKELYTERRDYCPFTAFRLNVSPIGEYGEGPCLVAMPDIRVLNKMAQLELKQNDINSNPIFMIDSNVTLNPNQVQLNGGDLIVVEPTINGREPIRPVPTTGNIRFLQLSMERLESRIRAILFADPLAPPAAQGEKATATEVSTRLEAWTRKSGASIGRLTQEYLNPHLDKILRVLRKAGKLNDIKISDGVLELDFDNKKIDFSYSSPLLELQNRKDLQNLNSVIEEFSGIFGAQGIAVAMDIAKIPGYVAEKSDIPIKLVRSEDKINALITQMNSNNKEAQAGGQDGDGGQAVGGQPPDQTQQLALPQNLVFGNQQ